MAGEEGWDPRLYEWWFTRNPLQAAIRRREQQAVWTALDPVLRAGDRVLEVGAGTGAYALELARRCREVVAVDVAAGMRDHLAERARREGLANVRVVAGRLPDDLPPGEHDGVIAVGVLNYVPELERALRALASSTTPGGWLVVVLPAPTPGGRLYALGELLTRRRVWLRSRADLQRAAAAAGLALEWAGTAGLSRRGFVLAARLRRAAAAAPPGGGSAAGGP